MSGLIPDVDPDGLLEYSVVYTDRALNHMSQSFQAVMKEISATLKRVTASLPNTRDADGQMVEQIGSIDGAIGPTSVNRGPRTRSGSRP